jgi:hypothetical protein
MAFALIRAKGPVRGDGVELTTKQLRQGIPAAACLALQIEAALTGHLKKIDLVTGEEVGTATALSDEQRLKLLDALVKKRLPDAKTAEVDEDRAADLENLPIDPEDIKRMPLSQLARVIEAQFEELKTPAPEETPVVSPAPAPVADDYLEE